MTCHTRSRVAAHLRQLRLDARQFPAPLVGHPVQFLVHQPHQVPDVALRQNALPDLLHNQALEAPGVEPRGVTGTAAPVEQRLADIVGELPALGRRPGERPTTAPALDQPTEQVGAGGPPGVRVGRPSGLQQGGHPPELLRGDDSGERMLHPHRRRLVFGVGPPHQRAGVDRVGEHLLDGSLQPVLAGGTGDPLGIQRLGDVQQALPAVGQREQAAHHPGGRLRHHQLRALLGAVRSIPACAGEPYSRCSKPPRSNAGELASDRRRGSIPACAGEPVARALRGNPGQPVSIPRVRGNRYGALLRGNRGSIPACAGEPSTGVTVRGAHQMSRGLSPRVRGNLYPSIPAAGVYPRVCGGTR